MSTIEWIALFAQFAGVVPELVDTFADQHPTLREPPPAERDSELHDEFLEEVAKRFGKDDPPSEPEADW